MFKPLHNGLMDFVLWFYASAIEIVLWQLVPLAMGWPHDGTMDPWMLASHDGWASITQDNMKHPRNNITPNWKEAKSLSPWLKRLPQPAIDSAKVVPANFPGDLHAAA